MRETEAGPSIQSAESLLLQQHRELVRGETFLIALHRASGILFLLASCFLPLSGNGGLLLIAMGSIMAGIFGFLAARLLEERRSRLEDLLVQELGRHEETEWAKRIYAEWQLHPWKHPLRYALLRIEPLLWASLTLAGVALRLF